MIDSEILSVPHTRMAERAFVLRPLCDLAPELRPRRWARAWLSWLPG